MNVLTKFKLCVIYLFFLSIYSAALHAFIQTGVGMVK